MVYSLQFVRHHGPFTVWYYHAPQRGNYYQVFNSVRSTRKPIVELEIMDSGKRYDYLNLDGFWGRVPRPFSIPSLQDR